MIAEQDFILRIRRLNRLAQSQTAINIIRALPDYSEADGNAHETAIREQVKKIGGDVHVMANGDLFLLFPLLNNEQRDSLKTGIVDILAVETDSDKTIIFYDLPADYMPLRERANVYVELANASEHLGPAQRATRALAADDVRGALTAWSLSQVETLLETIDIKRYVRTQPVYSQEDRGVWEKRFIDFYVSVGDLKRERFPRLNLETPQRLFLELCCSLDRKLLLELASHTQQWENKHISLNLSVETVLSAAFAQFCHVLPNHRRNQVNFEIHRSEVFLNFTTTRNALNVLKDEGFMVGIDGITPSVLPYIDFKNLNADYFKINVTREKWPEMQNADVLKALQNIPADKIIFSHCDHDAALQQGQKLGVRYYQGWLIDDVANAIIS
jgi:ABC-type transporter Mla MlaB component